MPVSPNNLQFSLASEYLERLKEKANPGESLGLTAKRLLIAALDAERGAIPSTDLTALTDRLTALEHCLDNSFYPVEENIPNRVTTLEERLAAIEVAIDCEHFPPEKTSDRLTAIESTLAELTSGRSVPDGALTDRLTAIESAIAELRSQIGAATSPVKRPASSPPPKRKGRSPSSPSSPPSKR